MAILEFTSLYRDRGTTQGIANLSRQFSKAGDAASGLEAATKRLEMAERRAADAAGQVRVAESKLQQIRANAKTTVAQRIAAEENLTKAQRRLTGAQQDVKRSSQQLTSVQKQVRQSVQQTTEQVGKSSTGMRSFGTAAAGFGTKAGVALGVAGVAAVGFGLKVASGNEQARISFTTMLGSAQKAEVFLKQLQKFAATTPFEFPELQTAASSLISAGINASKVIPIMRTLGDVTAGMGTGAQGVQRATVALQQMNAAGKITAEDLNQLRDAGIPVYDLLAAATKKSKTEVAGLAAAGKLGRKELEQLMAALESGKGLEKFNGLMEQQSKSLSGMISTLRDDLGQGLAGALQGLFPIIKASIGAWNDMGGATKATLGIIAGSAVAFGVAAGGAVKLSGAFQTLGLSAKSAKTAVGGVGAALTVATLAFGLYASSHAKAEAKIDDFTQALNGETEAVNKSVRAVAAKQLQDAGALESAQMLGLSLAEVTDAALGQGDALARIQPLLDGYVATGVNGTIVEQDRASAAGKVNDAIKGVSGSYNKATTEAKQMNAATADSAGAMGSMKDKTVSAKEALQQWRTEMVKSARAAIDLEGSQDAVEAAVDDATKAVKDNGKTLDNNTEKGRNNRAALRNLASSSIAYREKLIEQGASQKKVTGTTMQAREAFIKTAIKMGATRKEAKELADKFGLVDKKINDLNNKNVKTKVTFSVKGSGFKIHIPNTLSVVKDMGGAKPGPRAIDIGTGGQAPLTVTHSHGGGSASGGPIVHPKIAINRFPDPNAVGRKLQTATTASILRSGTQAIKDKQDLFMQNALTGPTGSVGAYSANMAGTIARLRAAGGRSFTTYPGHHPSMAKARDVTPHSWKIANTARASKSVWYVIYQMRIASKNHGNNWRPFHTSSRRGDWQHRRHVHVAWYDRGGILKPGLTLAYNGTGRNERVVPAGRGSGGGTVVHNYYSLPNYLGSTQELVNALTQLNRQGRLQVIKR